MKRTRTGNIPRVKQYLYVLVWLPGLALIGCAAAYLALKVNPGLIWSLLFTPVKIGIGGDVVRRQKQVDDSMPGAVVRVFSMRIQSAYEIEQALHRALRFLNVPMFGSGKTEWFFAPAALPAIVLAAIAWTWERAAVFAVAVLVIYLILK